MDTIKIKVKGITEDVRIVHISDSHLLLPLRQDGEKLYNYSVARKDFFEREAAHRTGENYTAKACFYDAVAHAKKVNADKVVLTGDIVEAPTSANVKLMTETLDGLDYLYTFGNHDYYFLENSLSPKAQRAKNLHLFQSKIKNDILFCHQQYKGLNIVVMDNSLRYFTKKQLQQLRDIFQSESNILLFFHVPLYEEAIENQYGHAMLCGDNEKLQHTKWDDDATDSVLDLIEHHSKSIIGIFCGDMHYKHIGAWRGKIMQYICAPTYLNEYFDIIIQKETD